MDRSSASQMRDGSNRGTVATTVAWNRRVARSKSKLSAGAPGADLTLTFREQMIAGGIARGIAQTLLHPVDVARTRLQARNVTMKWTPNVFIKGVLPQVLLASPAGAIQFVAFEKAKSKLAEISDDPSTRDVRLLLAGAFGALSAATCRVPQEVLKQRIQADIYPNLAVALRETLSKSGPAGLYNGWLATLSRDVPWNALSFMFHGLAKRAFTGVKKRAPENDENLVLAGIAGATAAVIMTPVDVVKTRLMTQKVGVAAEYSGIIGTLRKIVVEEGAPTLMKGVIPRIMFLAPLAGITFSVYEAVAKQMKSRKAAAMKLAAAPTASSKSDQAHGKSRNRRRPSTVTFVASPCFSLDVACRRQ